MPLPIGIGHFHYKTCHRPCKLGVLPFLTTSTFVPGTQATNAHSCEVLAAHGFHKFLELGGLGQATWRCLAWDARFEVYSRELASTTFDRGGFGRFWTCISFRSESTFVV